MQRGRADRPSGLGAKHPCGWEALLWLGCALLVWVRLKYLAIANKSSVYQLKNGLLKDYLIQQLKNPSLGMVLA